MGVNLNIRVSANQRVQIYHVMAYHVIRMCIIATGEPANLFIIRVSLHKERIDYRYRFVDKKIQNMKKTKTRNYLYDFFYKNNRSSFRFVHALNYY